MKTVSSQTLVNPATGQLAFKVFAFDGSQFDHLQRMNHYTVMLLQKGGGELKADFAEYPLPAPGLLCFSPYQPFMLEEKEPLSGTALYFHPDFFCIHKHQQEVACNGVLFNNIYRPPYLSLTNAEAEMLAALLEQMKKETTQVQLAQYELLVSYLKIFLINASRLKTQQHPEAQAAVAGEHQPFILQRLKDAIEEHYRSKHSAADYAGLLHISPKALGKITKTHFNKTLTRLISERIVIEAKRELYLTSKAVKEIAWELGFADEYYFSRFFKNNAEVSPQIYRQTVGFARAEI
jgi:AraC family transcriptional regulator, transcriptional activator of pobA